MLLNNLTNQDWRLLTLNFDLNFKYLFGFIFCFSHQNSNILFWMKGFWNLTCTFRLPVDCQNKFILKFIYSYAAEMDSISGWSFFHTRINKEMFKIVRFTFHLLFSLVKFPCTFSKGRQLIINYYLRVTLVLWRKRIYKWKYVPT